MCYFITVACDTEHVPVLRAVLRSSFRLYETRNESVVEHLSGTWSAFHLVQGMCACDLYRQYRDEERDFEAKVERFRERHKKAKYRKRGWTENKIDKAIEQMRLDRMHREQMQKASFVGIRSDLRSAIGEIVKYAGGVGVLVHWYSGDTEREGFLVSEASISLRDFLCVDEPIHPDVLYFVK